MSKTVTATISDDVLASDSADSDRIVYSNYFVPVLVTANDQTPLIPVLVKQQILELILHGDLSRDRLDVILRELKVPETWAANGMDQALAQLTRAPVRPKVLSVRAGTEMHIDQDVLTQVARTLTEADYYLDSIGRDLDPAQQSLLKTASGRLAWASEKLREPAAEAVYPGRETAAEPPPPNLRPDADLELVAGLLKSTVGVAFLDRTRITPAGFAIGEHVYALGLTPGEEAVLEQKTFTKRQTTFEEQTEQERQIDLELSSAYSTELQEGLERQHSRSDTWGLHVNHTGSYASPISPYGQWNANHTIDATKNVEDASAEARRRSVKDGQQSSSKVAARYRTQHKTVFRLTMEQVFEATSRRTIRNPNRTTPITLHYFKVLQRVRLRQERYGVRLCWAPSVADPGAGLDARVREGRRRILDAAVNGLPPRPDQPVPASATPGGKSTEVEEQTGWSRRTYANQQNPLNGQRSDYDVDITVEDGWTWDREVKNIIIDPSLTTRTPGTFDIYRSGRPTLADGKVQVTVHVDAGDRPGAQPIIFQVGVRCVRDKEIPEKASDDTVYQAALEDWRMRVKDWDVANEKALDDARRAADTFEHEMFATFSPVNEMVSQLVERYFKPSKRQIPYEAWEIDYWQRLFDWERASYATYPQWWSGHPARDPLRDPADFINASWAKLYLPVRVGLEKAALRWIFSWAAAAQVDPAVAKRLDEVVAQVTDFRREVLGAADEVGALAAPCAKVEEPFACLAEWTELMPTDGTHVEVVLGATSAADEATAAETASAAALRGARLENEKAIARLRDKALERMSDAATIRVHVDVPGRDD